MGFGELVRRLFEPVGSIKKQYIYFLLSVSNWFVIDFFIVFFGDKIGNSINNGDIERIKWYVIRFFIVFIVTYIVKYLTRTK
ncbi:hypothetical protein KA405_00250 [Patescibacteria group bacterium]|nr:hypothetical protein [Patescibacteria group bacterium]